MAVIVTGLSPTADVTGVRRALASAGFDGDALRVVEPGDDDDGLGGAIGSELGADSRRVVMSMGESNDLGTGTGVPGITNYRPTESLLRGGGSDDRLAEFGIRDDEMGNYVEALSRGRAVVAFFAEPETGERVEALLREHGILNVRRSVR